MTDKKVNIGLCQRVVVIINKLMSDMLITIQNLRKYKKRGWFLLRLIWDFTFFVSIPKLCGYLIKISQWE